MNARKILMEAGKALTYVVFILCLMPSVAQAQLLSRHYVRIGWQFDFPISSGFLSGMNDLGLNIDAGYFLTPNISVGGFVGIQRQHGYIPRQTFTSGTMSVNTDQVRSLLRVPFGVSANYRFAWRSSWQPYVGIRLGVCYAEAESVQQLYAYSDKSWNLYVSPEAGLNFYPFRRKYIGFSLAAYYSYAGNRSRVFYGNIDGMHNAGFRLGVIF